MRTVNVCKSLQQTHHIPLGEASFGAALASNGFTNSRFNMLESSPAMHTGHSILPYNVTRLFCYGGITEQMQSSVETLQLFLSQLVQSLFCEQT